MDSPHIVHYMPQDGDEPDEYGQFEHEPEEYRHDLDTTDPEYPVVEQAIGYLYDHGTTEASSSQHHPGDWYTHPDEYGQSAHLHGLTPEQEHQVFHGLAAKQMMPYRGIEPETLERHPDPWMDNEPGATTFPAQWTYEGRVTLPPQNVTLGPVEASWEEIDPGVALIKVQGGSIDDRVLVHDLLRVQLASFGIEQAQFFIGQDDEFRKTAHWRDIMAKAKRLIESGQVHVLRNSANVVAGHVVGDHGEYNSELNRDDPNSWSISMWNCECPWAQYAWQRTRQWKKYEGRVCAHVLALFWRARGIPLDEDVSPDGPALPPGMKGPAPAPPEAPLGPPAGLGEPQQVFGPEGGPGPSAPPMQPGPMPGGADMPGPPGADIIPPQPQLPGMLPPYVPGTTPNGMQAPPNAFSVPGARPPSPANPGQYPGDGTGTGGTFSKVAHEPSQPPHYRVLTDPGVEKCGTCVMFNKGKCWGYGNTPVVEDGKCDSYYRDGRKTASLKVRKPYPPFPDFYQRSPNECTLNASELEGWEGTRYAEGWARGPGEDWTQHAWLVHPQGHIIDPTWDDADESFEYREKRPGEDPFEREAASAQFENGMKVRLLESEWGVAEGRSEAHGSGEYREIPQGTQGEVMGQDATTGWVEVLFPLDTGGPMEPYHIRSFIEPKQLKIVAYPPGSPFIKRVGPHSSTLSPVTSGWQPEGWDAPEPYSDHGDRCPMCKNHRLEETSPDHMQIRCPECGWEGERFVDINAWPTLEE